MGERRRLGLLIFLLWLAWECCWAGEPSRFAISQVSARPPVVTVYLEVLDKNGEAVVLLHPSELSASIQGQPVKVAQVTPFDASGEGVAYIFLVDVSESIGLAQFKQIQQAIDAWIDGLKSADRMAIFTFGAQNKELIGLTDDKASLKGVLQNLKPTEPQTKLYLALRGAMNLSRQTTAGLPDRRVIVILSDGKDEGSGVTEEDVVRLIPQSHVPIYAIGYSRLGMPEKEHYLQVLNRFASLSGGIYSAAASPTTLKTAYEEMQSVIRRPFVVRLDCAGCRTDSQLHPLEMTRTAGTGPDTVRRTSSLDAHVIAPPPSSSSAATPSSPSSSTTMQPWWKMLLSWQGIVSLVVVFAVIFAAVLWAKLKGGSPEPQKAVDSPPLIVDSEMDPARTPVPPPGGLRLQLTVVAGKEHRREDFINLVGKSVIGRDRGCDVSFPDDTEMSGRHCELSLVGQHVEVRDLGSTNGTLLNGAELASSHRLEDGDLLRAGRTEFRVSFGGGT